MHSQYGLPDPANDQKKKIKKNKNTNNKNTWHNMAIRANTAKYGSLTGETKNKKTALRGARYPAPGSQFGSPAPVSLSSFRALRHSFSEPQLTAKARRALDARGSPVLKTYSSRSAKDGVTIGPLQTKLLHWISH